jgi:hypothetical protein
MSKINELIDVLGMYNGLEEGLKRFGFVVTDAQVADLYNRTCVYMSTLYTEDEIEQLIAIHKLPVMQKATAMNPRVTVESYAIGQQWALDHGLTPEANFRDSDEN